MADEDRTLEELESYDAGERETAATPMVARCIRLQKTPLHALSDADARLLIGQGIGLKYLVPKALARLVVEPLLQADYYSGDLLSALLRINRTIGYKGQKSSIASGKSRSRLRSTTAKWFGTARTFSPLTRPLVRHGIEVCNGSKCEDLDLSKSWSVCLTKRTSMRTAATSLLDPQEIRGWFVPAGEAPGRPGDSPVGQKDLACPGRAADDPVTTACAKNRNSAVRSG